MTYDAGFGFDDAFSVLRQSNDASLGFFIFLYLIIICFWEIGTFFVFLYPVL